LRCHPATALTPSRGRDTSVAALFVPAAPLRCLTRRSSSTVLCE
jgi:hypothetical protein